MNLPIEIDRRQRVIAALALCALDLPQEATAWADQMLEACKLCPGLTMDEIPMQGARNRRLALKRIRDLADEMLEEIDAQVT